MPNLAWIAHPDGFIYWYNKRWYEYTGTTLKEMEGWGWQKLHDTKELDNVLKNWKLSLATGDPFEMTFPLKGSNGKFKPFLTRIVPLKDASGKIHHWFGTCTDVSDLSEAKEALSISEERFKATFEHAAVGIAHLDLNGKWLMVNNQLCKIVGYTKEELLKLTFQDITYKPDLELDLKYVNKLQKGRIHSYTIEKRYVKKDKSLVWISLTGSIVKDSNGINKYFIAIIKDITETRKAQEEKQQLELLSRERNELIKISKAKDEFISIASHQLRTPATVVKQYLDLLENGYAGTLSNEQAKFIKIAYNNNERQLHTVNALLKTAQLDAENFTIHRISTDIAALLRGVANESKVSMQIRKQTLHTEGLDKDVKLKIDPVEIKLSINNLLENASKYSHDGKVIYLKLKKLKTKITITVEDKGVGISPENHHRIYEKFARVDNELSDTVTGTGFGLYWVKQIVELHGGSITLKSELHKGSKFIINLPL
jgi:PAS domain S-box-containing protein